MRASSERWGRRVGFCFALSSAACGGPELGDIVGNEVNLTMTAVASAPEVAAIGEPQGGLGVSRAYVSTSSLSLMPCAENASSLTLGARGYDLLQEPSPNERVTTASWQLCGLRLDVDPVSESAVDGVPRGSSLYVEGQDAAGATFTLASERSCALLFTPDEAASFGEQPLLLGFDVSLWLAGLPLPAAQAEMAGKLFADQLQESAALYVDSNGNRVLDDDEKTPVARARAAR